MTARERERVPTMTARELVRALHRALDRVAPATRVSAALAKRPVPNAVSVIAVGKAAPAMTRGVLALRPWEAAVRDVLVVTTDATDVSEVASDARVTVMRAAHPVPDRRSVAAARACLARASAADGLLLLLISGGASSLLCAPIEGVTLRDKQAVTRAMLRSGAPIHDVNLVRRHLSRIKGGGLARAAGAPVVTLVLSDVVGGEIDAIGSGPGVGDRTTVGEARRLLRRHAPAFRSLSLAKTGAAPTVRDARIVAGPEDLARALATELRAGGLEARVLAGSVAGVTSLADAYVRFARRLRSGTAIVRAAEPSLVVPSRAGRGGRSTHLAALVALGLPPSVLFMAAASDGVDGASGTAGACVDATFAREVGEDAIRSALARFDTGPLHRRAGTALLLGPTGHNLADVHVLLRRADAN